MVSLSGARVLIAQFLIVAVFALSGCSLKIQHSVPQFDRVAGKGPLLLVRNDETNNANQFFIDTLGTSEALRLVVREHGTPDAISVEREFLQPVRLKLYYSAREQVYVCVNQDGRWYVVGVERASEEDNESLGKQRSKQSQTVAELATPAQATAFQPTPPLAVPALPSVGTSELRGQLKPPSAAGLASLRRGPNGYTHQVTFVGETLYSLADWYTEDPGNAAMLASSSQRPIQRPLRLGDEIVIPRSLMRNPEPFPEALVP